jgi:hypothetical protein
MRNAGNDTDLYYGPWGALGALGGGCAGSGGVHERGTSRSVVLRYRLELVS